VHPQRAPLRRRPQGEPADRTLAAPRPGAARSAASVLGFRVRVPTRCFMVALIIIWMDWVAGARELVDREPPLD